MINKEVKIKRKHFFSKISGAWESELFTKNENANVKLKFFLGKKFKFGESPNPLNAILEDSFQDKVIYSISFWWVNDELITSNEFFKGVLKLNSVNELGIYYPNTELIDENQILKFHKLKSL